MQVSQMGDGIARRVLVFHRRQSRNDPPRVAGMPVINERGQIVLNGSVIIEDTFFNIAWRDDTPVYSGKLIIAVPEMYCGSEAALWNASDSVYNLGEYDWEVRGDQFLGRWL